MEEPRLVDPSACAELLAQPPGGQEGAVLPLPGVASSLLGKSPGKGETLSREFPYQQCRLHRNPQTVRHDPIVLDPIVLMRWAAITTSGAAPQGFMFTEAAL